VPLPEPEAGLVIHFNYLWRRERDRGVENARYPRPCAIVLAHRREAEGATVVVVVPITHSAPDAETKALALPGAVKRHLGLDDTPSWVVVNEVNEFVWPGFDLQPNAKGEVAYGFIPKQLYQRIRDGVLESARSGSLGRAAR
jgi:hypothetical protein